MVPLLLRRSFSFATGRKTFLAYSIIRCKPREAVSFSPNPPLRPCGAFDSRNIGPCFRANLTEMTESEEQQVTKVVLDYLNTADMAVATERTVMEHVKSTLQLSKPVAEYKRLVSTTIDQYLETLDLGEAAVAVDAEDEPRPAGGKGGRKRAGGVASEDSAAKRSRGNTGEDVLFSVNLGPRRKARVRQWQGKLQVDIREFYEYMGSEAPTQKGLSMDPGQWARLVLELPALLAAQQAGDTSAPARPLSKTRMADINTFKGNSYLDLREYYDNDGQLAPTKKGVSLTLSETKALLAAASDITAAAGGPVEHPELPTSTTTGKAAAVGEAPQAHGPSSEGARKAAAAGPSAAGPAPAAAGGGGSGAGGLGSGGAGGRGGGVAPQEVLELGSHKRLSISRFGGRLSVDLREFYEKDGQILPGKKGIALSPADWGTLTAHMNDVTAALDRKDLSYKLQLSGMRRVYISPFKGMYYVGIREYYNKGGEEAPSAKGLNMNPQQWVAAVAGAPAITAALEQAQNH